VIYNLCTICIEKLQEFAKKNKFTLIHLIDALSKSLYAAFITIRLYESAKSKYLFLSACIIPVAIYQKVSPLRVKLLREIETGIPYITKPFCSFAVRVKNLTIDFFLYKY
jgi:hypothetical protein